jgi:hypothetical protein
VYGFRGAIMANPAAANIGQCSERFSTLAQEWLSLAAVNYETGFVWDDLYGDPFVAPRRAPDSQ